MEKNKLPEGWTSFQYDKYLKLEYGKSQTKKNRKKGKIPVYGSSGIDGYHNDALVQNPCLIIGRKGSVGEIHHVHEPCWPIDTTYFLENHLMYDQIFLFFLLKHIKLDQLDSSTTVPSTKSIARGVSKGTVLELDIILTDVDITGDRVSCIIMV